MKAAIAGLGWVTPLGKELDAVSCAIHSGARPETTAVVNPETGKAHQCYAVPAGGVEYLSKQPRLRRSSRISYFAIAAAEAAFADAGVQMTPAVAGRTAIVLAVADGGVIYTRRFYEQIVKQGASAASPLLFPETVYNAPASHLAALLGIDGASYTLVGDSSVGLTALHFGAQLIGLGDVDYCLVVGCEELDWILCEAFDDWRLARTPLAEGAGAVLLARNGSHTLATHAGVPFHRRDEAGASLDNAIDALNVAEPVDLIVASANGTFVDSHESAVCNRRYPKTRSVAPARSLGQAPGASALWQTITATLALRDKRGARALVPVIGFNQHACAAVIEGPSA